MANTVTTTALIVGILAALIICLIWWVAKDIKHIAERNDKE